MNILFPKIIKQMINDSSKRGYIKALKLNSILPYKINLLHYFAYQNQSDCIDECLDIGVKYIRDKFENTPLEYAMKRNSN